MKVWTWLLCLLLVVHIDAASSHSRKKLRSKSKDVDTDDDDDDSETEQPAPAPAAAAAPAEDVEAETEADPPAPAPAKPAKFKVEDEAVEMHEMMEAAHEMFEDYNVSNPRDSHKEELAGLMYIEEVYEEKLDELEDESYIKKIEKEEIPVANETSPGLASMLGEMREEMHQYAIPFYKKFLKAKLKELEKQQHKLVSQIAAEHHGQLEKSVKEEDAEDEEEEEEPEPETTTTAKPKVKAKKRGAITAPNMVFALIILVVLAAIAFFLSRRSGDRRG